jgi:RHH-type proline utilization regulon transcriptional repressor/proline dehydrogenase/delta 1-pyrroline-5-carboxylate dehydrogenase
VLPLMRICDHSVELPNSSAEHVELDRLQTWSEMAEQTGAMETTLADDLQRVINSQRKAVDEEFSRQHDSLRLVGQDNSRRYLPVKAITIRVDRSDQLRDALVCLSAAVAVSAQVTLSFDPSLDESSKQLLESPADYVPRCVDPIEETIDALSQRIHNGGVNRLRLLEKSPQYLELLTVCGERFVTSVDEPVLSDGRFECLRYLDEQSVSHDYHRYGNLGRRASEVRRVVR